MTIRRSPTRSLIVGALALAGVRALALCELPAPLFAVFAAAVLAYAARDVLRHGDALLGRDEHGRWHLARPGERPFTGRLVEDGYRGALLVVMVLDGRGENDALGRPDGGTSEDRSGRVAPGSANERPSPRGLPIRFPFRHRRHVTVFADSVSPRDFSRLHFELALAAGDDPGAGTSPRR